MSPSSWLPSVLTAPGLLVGFLAAWCVGVFQKHLMLPCQTGIFHLCRESCSLLVEDGIQKPRCECCGCSGPLHSHVRACACVRVHADTRARSPAFMYFYLLLSFPGQRVVSLLPRRVVPIFSSSMHRTPHLIPARIPWPLGTILPGPVIGWMALPGAHQGIWADGKSQNRICH